MKKVLSLALAVALCLSLFVMTSVSAEAELTGKLEVWHYWAGQTEQTCIREIADEFCALHPGVEIVITSFARDELGKLLTMGAVSGELPDVCMMDNPVMNAYIKMGLCMDITDRFMAWDEHSLYYEGPLKSCTDDGRIYGIPHNSNCLELFYDVDMLAGAGVEPPTTWDELLNVCEKLKATYPDVYPIGFSANNNEEGTFQFMPFLLSTGAELSDLSSDEAIKAVSFWKELIDKGYTPKDVINWGQNEVNTRFGSGNLAMQVNGPWQTANLRLDAPDKNWSVTLVPKDDHYASVLGGENFAVTSACENPDLGWAWLSFFCNGKNAATFCSKMGRFTPRSDGNEYTDFWSTDPISQVFAEGMQYAQPRGPHPRWSEFSSILSGAIQEVLTGAKTPEAAMTDAQAKATAILN